MKVSHSLCISLTGVERNIDSDKYIESWQIGINNNQGYANMTFGTPEQTYGMKYKHSLNLYINTWPYYIYPDTYIALHPAGTGISSITFPIANYSTFTGVVGLGSTNCKDLYGIDRRDGVKFRFYLDNSSSAILETSQLKLLNDSEQINIDITGATTLTIEVDALGHSDCDHSLIAIPELCGMTPFRVSFLRQKQTQYVQIF